MVIRTFDMKDFGMYDTGLKKNLQIIYVPTCSEHGEPVINTAEFPLIPKNDVVSYRG